MSANEKVNEAILLAFGGILDDKGEPSKPIEGYTFSTLISNEVLPQFVKGVLRMRRTAELMAQKDEKLGNMAKAMVADYINVAVSTRSIHTPTKPCFIDIITTQKGRMTVRGMDENKKPGIGEMLKNFGGGGGQGG